MKGKISREEYKEDLHATDAIGPLALGIAFDGPGAVGEELISFIFESVTGVPLFNDPSDFIKTGSKKVEKEVVESSTKLIKKVNGNFKLSTKAQYVNGLVNKDIDQIEKVGIS